MKISEKARRTLRIVAIAGLLTVLAALGVLIYVISVGPCTFLVNPGCGAPKAQLFLEGSWINSPTSLTLKLLNGGSGSTSLSGYYVHDSVGHVYAAPGWTGPTIQPNSPLNVTFTIDGKDFTFQPKSSYTVTVDASIGYNFSFGVST